MDERLETMAREIRTLPERERERKRIARLIGDEVRHAWRSASAMVENRAAPGHVPRSGPTPRERRPCPEGDDR